MATFTFSGQVFTTGIKMGSSDFDFGVGNGSGTFSETAFVFTDGTNTATFTGTNLHFTTFFGFLTDVTDGTFDSITAVIGGVTAMTATGLNVSAPEFFDLAVARNWSGLWNLVLSGNDNVTGTGFKDRLLGAAGRDTLDGGNGNDVLKGGGGRDVLIGGQGHDTLNGGGDADQFLFRNAVLDKHSDVIVDFVSGSDRIVLDNDFFTRLAVGPLGSSQFVIGPAAGDPNDFLIYHAATGELFYDRDGNGVAPQVKIADLGIGTMLLASDIQVID